MCSKGGLSAVRSVATKPHRVFSAGRRKLPTEQAAAEPAAVTGGNAQPIAADADQSDGRRVLNAIRRRRESAGLLNTAGSMQQRTLLTRLGGNSP